MDFKAKRRFLKVEIDGESFELKFPTVGVIRKHDRDLKDEAKALDTIIKLICDLGLPEEKIDSLEAEDLLAIGNILVGKKKTN